MMLIYNDEGASARCVEALLQNFPQFSVQLASGAELQNPAVFENCTLFVMPGGRSLPFYDKLSDVGNQNIVDYVKNGGVYLGICAGAYYACRQTIFAKGLAKELILPGSLNLFEGDAIGPVFNAEQFEYQSEQGASIVDVKTNEGVFPVYFNGGCYFSGTDAIDVIAQYANHLPTIIKVNYGKGQVILSGVHPEYTQAQVQKPAALKHQLQSIEDKRKELFQHIIKHAL